MSAAICSSLLFVVPDVQVFERVVVMPKNLSGSIREPEMNPTLIAKLGIPLLGFNTTRVPFLRVSFSILPSIIDAKLTLSAFTFAVLDLFFGFGASFEFLRASERSLIQ